MATFEEDYQSALKEVEKQSKEQNKGEPVTSHEPIYSGSSNVQQGTQVHPEEHIVGIVMIVAAVVLTAFLVSRTAWYLGVLKKALDFSGRSSRREYWMFGLWLTLLTLAITFLIGGVLAYQGNSDSQIHDISDTFTLIWQFFVVIPSGLALSVRRMHDTNHSGWWLLMPIVNLILAIKDSQPGENRFGHNPKENSQSQTASSDKTSLNTDKFYEEALLELENGTFHKGMWARLLAEADGDESKAKARYIKARTLEIAQSQPAPSLEIPNDKEPNVRIEREPPDRSTSEAKPSIAEQIVAALPFLCLLGLLIWIATTSDKPKKPTNAQPSDFVQAGPPSNVAPSSNNENIYSNESIYSNSGQLCKYQDAEGHIIFSKTAVKDAFLLKCF